MGARVRVLMRANEVLMYDRAAVAPRHARLTRRGDTHDDLDHYLEILLGKPGALAGSTALATARRKAASPRRMRRSGPPPAPRTATRPAPAS
ncbi:hypothetical protein ACFFG9_53365 [Kutzneria buriramensis]|uniref:hypothetical protein n=1 Tax=Kutzneria buriramensis TaxID=1045776 RepID=UPI0035EEDE4A